MGDSMTSLLIPIGFLLMNIVILLIWWIVRHERSRITQIEDKVDTVARIIMEIQISQKRRNEELGQFHGEHVMAEEVSRQNNQHEIPERMTEVSDEGSENLEDLEENNQETHEIHQPRVVHEIHEHITIDVSENKHEIQDDDSDYGSELDSLTDDEDVQIHNQNDAHDKISVSDVESLDEHNEPEMKTINLHDISQSSKEVTYQGMFELGEVHELNESQQDNEDESPPKHELDEEQYKHFSKMTVKELRKLATDKGFHHVDKLKKKTLVIQLSTKPIENAEENMDTKENNGEEN